MRLSCDNRFVQGVERADRELLDAEALVGHLVAEGSMFAFLAAHRQDLFADEEFEDLFPSGQGRPSIPASVMASILVLQTLHDLSDRETAEAARCDLRWKVATGMALDHNGFDPTTLVYWRKRLAKSDRPHRINEAVRRVVAETGILRGRRKRAVDSTILADAVATQDTITQLISAIRRVGRIVPGAAEVIAAVCTGHDYSRPGKPVIDWDEPGAKDALVSALVNDANALLEALAEVDRRAEEPVAAALALLALVAGQDVEPAEGSDGTDGRWRIARKVAPDRVISTSTPMPGTPASHPRRAGTGIGRMWPPNPRRGSSPTKRSPRPPGRELRRGGGRAVPGRRPRRRGRRGRRDERGGCEWYGDSAYGTGDLRDAIGEAGHEAVIKPKPLQAPVEGGFTVDDFTVDEQAGVVGCPAGHTRPISRPGWPASAHCAAAARCASSARVQHRPQNRPAPTR